MFEKVNLEKELFKARNKSQEKKEEKVLNAFKDLFVAEWERDRRIFNTLNTGAVSGHLPSPEKFDSNRIFSIEDIKKLCIDYRLRFLSTKHFKAKFPSETISAIKEVEKSSDEKIDAFMIMAPAVMFSLEDVNKDPLLFAPLADGRYYLIHKWGGDLSAFRKLRSWPVRSPFHLLAFIFAVSIIAGFVVPISYLSETGTFFSFYRLAFIAWNIIFLSAMTSFVWFSLHQKFSTMAWNDKHFN